MESRELHEALNAAAKSKEPATYDLVDEHLIFGLTQGLLEDLGAAGIVKHARNIQRAIYEGGVRELSS